jgi:hypothetical protein
VLQLPSVRDGLRAAREVDMSARTGPGIKRGWTPSPDVVAERLARMNTARRSRRAERLAAQRELVEQLSGLSLDTLVRGVSTRQWTVAVMHLGGYDVAETARALGYATVNAITRVLQQPAVQQLIARIREAQLERVLRGTYGVAAQAKAAAPAVMEHVAELAGGRKDRATGARVGRAKRDADAIRAADLVLTTSGDKIARTAHLHLHVLEQLSDAELEAFSARGEWPERFAGVAGLLPGPEGSG